MALPFSIRSATQDDIPGIHAIQEHYVKYTVMNFSYTPNTMAEMVASYNSIIGNDYPYIVAVPAAAVSSHEPGQSSSHDIKPSVPLSSPQVIYTAPAPAPPDPHDGPLPAAVPRVSEATGLFGYAYVSELRTRAAYQWTGELSIYCHPAYTGKGVGRMLLRAITAALRASRGLPVDEAHSSAEKSYLDQIQRQGLRFRPTYQLFVCMSVSPDPVEAEKLRAFYAREGFEQTGLFKKVGWKFGTWIDTRYMQMELK